jgi:hypothetical protein
VPDRTGSAPYQSNAFRAFADELGRVSVGGDDGAHRSILCATLAYANRAEK